MVLIENVDCLFVVFIALRYSFLCNAIYWFLSQLVYGCIGYSGMSKTEECLEVNNQL